MHDEICVLCTLNFQPVLIRILLPDSDRHRIYRLINSHPPTLSPFYFAEEDYDQFCLAYMFTYRDFEMGTLGLAWTGDLKNAGGVCEKNGVSWRGRQFRVML